MKSINLMQDVEGQAVMWYIVNLYLFNYMYMLFSGIVFSFGNMTQA